jgi:hypothetical protein
LQEHSASGGESIGKIMIIGHRMKDCSSENNDHWTQDKIIHPDARRFWVTFPGHGYAEGVCHKNSSGNCVRGMSNPITPYHKNSSSN